LGTALLAAEDTLQFKENYDHKVLLFFVA